VSVVITRNLDIDGSGLVDSNDLNIVKTSYGCVTGSPCYNPKADIDADGEVGIVDAAYVANYYGALNYH
jgi:hypothetical protein